MAAQLAKQVGAGGVEWVVGVQVQLVHQGERGCGALDLADGDGAVEGHDWGGGDGEQLVVQGEDGVQSVCSTVGASACMALMAAWS